MAKYDVVYACGHTGSVNLYGPGKDREWKLKSLATALCPECTEKERAQIGQEAAAKSTKDGHAAMIGSEKQLAWAYPLRATAIKILAESIPEFKKANNAKGVDVCKALVERIAAETKASNIIDVFGNLEYNEDKSRNIGSVISKIKLSFNDYKKDLF